MLFSLTGEHESLFNVNVTCTDLFSLAFILQVLGQTRILEIFPWRILDTSFSLIDVDTGGVNAVPVKKLARCASHFLTLRFSERSRTVSGIHLV